jgi:NADH dehydrogenase FAD-containing subunit
MRAVLVGAGHSHLYLAKRAKTFHSRKIELVLVEPRAFDYSGLATGVLGGQYEASLDRIDAQRLIEANGGRFIRDRAVGLDHLRRELQLESGATLDYDAISFNIGSEVDASLIPGADDAWTVKPIANLWRLKKHLQETLKRGRLRALVVGGGATGVEIAANMDALARQCGRRLELTLLSSAAVLLSQASHGASVRIATYLQKRGIRLGLGQNVTCVVDSCAETEEGRRYGFDVLVLATGLNANSLTHSLGLAFSEREGIKVDSSLCSLSAKNVFGVGDCIVFEGRKLPMVGVHGVRQAPILMHNMLACLSGGQPRRYRPPKRYLSILNLGCGEALALWGRFFWFGRASMRWKDYLDRRFLAKYR